MGKIVILISLATLFFITVGLAVSIFEGILFKFKSSKFEVKNGGDSLRLNICLFIILSFVLYRGVIFVSPAVLVKINTNSNYKAEQVKNGN